MTSYLLPMSENEGTFKELVQGLRDTIVHHHNGIPLSDYKISRVCKVENALLEKRFLACQKRIDLEIGSCGVIKILYHATPHANTIIQKGFDVNFSASTNMFGKGIYFADLSSKSNQYAWGNMVGCPTHRSRSCTTCIRQLLICKCYMGQQYKATKANVPIPEGYHSVVAVPGAVIDPLRYPEYSILNGDQILPMYLVEYTIVP